MKRLTLAAIVAVVAGSAALALPAFAQTPPAPPASASSTAPAAAPSAKAKPPVRMVDARTCIRDTGSHIPPPKGQCLPVWGRSYSAQDIERTGQINIGRALQMLDPSVRVGGN